jgi:CO/xanthine dehydrogenase FAD-binding subunit
MSSAGYQRPETLEAALAALASGGRVLAGGTDLYPAGFSGAVVDVSAVAEMRGIRIGPREIRIGASASWTEVAAAALPAGARALQQAAGLVGGWQIQNAGTVGGNLCNASPAADGVPPLLAMGAEVEIAGPAGLRRVPLGAFLKGPRRVALDAGEVLVAVVIPAGGASGVSRFLKLGARAHLVISIAMVAVRIVPREGVVAEACVAVGACSPVAMRLTAFERALEGVRLEEAAGVPVDVSALAPLDDIRATSGYRREAAAELVRRAVAEVVACC